MYKSSEVLLSLPICTDSSEPSLLENPISTKCSKLLCAGSYFFSISFQEYDKEADSGSRVYPYGDRWKKEHRWKRAKTQNEARTMAVSSVPDITRKITGSDIENFLLDCFQAKPSKFPVYLITGMVAYILRLTTIQLL